MYSGALSLVTYTAIMIAIQNLFSCHYPSDLLKVVTKLSSNCCCQHFCQNCPCLFHFVIITLFKLFVPTFFIMSIFK